MNRHELLDHQFRERQLARCDFPPDFVFGVATSAYQIEGACSEGGRGASIWDEFSHIEGKILDGSNGDVAVDHYHRYKEDIDLIASLGFNGYRFSISWSRIFPDGLGEKVNEEGIKFYNNLINYLLEKGIQPFVTLYHWDLPLHLEKSIGGWLNKQIIEYFAIYSETCFSTFGDRVKNWMTLNEPLQTAVNGYVCGIFAPGRHANSTVEPYLCAHHQILAHAKAVSIYEKKYKEKQGGQIGLVVDCEWAEANSDKVEDQAAASRRLDFQLGWYLHPLYYGDYPQTMRERLGDRLPIFTDEDKVFLQTPMDFVGINHYTSRFISHEPDNAEGTHHFYKLQETKRNVEWEDGKLIGEKAASEWLYVVPWGLRRLLNHVAKTYNNIPVYVTENGMDEEEDEHAPLQEILDDKLRVRYFKEYLSSVALAMKDGVNVRGYFAWSLLDNFEWAQGYTKRFGIVYVDYKKGLNRHPKSSAHWFKRFLKDGESKYGKEE